MTDVPSMPGQFQDIRIAKGGTPKNSLLYTYCQSLDNAHARKRHGHTLTQPQLEHLHLRTQGGQARYAA